MYLIIPKVSFGDTLNQGQYFYKNIPVSYGNTYGVYLDVQSGDCDLYGKYGSQPTTGSRDHSSTNIYSNDEYYIFSSTSSNTYYVGVYSYSSMLYAARITWHTVTLIAMAVLIITGHIVCQVFSRHLAKI